MTRVSLGLNRYWRVGLQFRSRPGPLKLLSSHSAIREHWVEPQKLFKLIGTGFFGWINYPFKQTIIEY